MDFSLSKEQETIRKYVREFCKKEILPLAEKIEETESIPDDLVDKMAKFKLFGIPFDRKYGGSGAGYVASTLAMEEIAKVSGAVSMFVGVNYLTGIPIDMFGTEEQKAKYLTPLAMGKCVGSFAFTEAATGSDPRAITTKAVLEGSEYVINGSKRFITAADKNGIIVLIAKDGEGVSAFIGEKNVAGYTIPKPWKKLGMHGVSLCDIYLENYRIPASNLLGSSGNGFNILLDTIAIGKLDTSISCLGCAEAALEEAVKYAKERMSRNKPIASMQSIQSLIADMAMQIEASRLLLYKLAWLADQKQNIRYESALAKAFVTEAAVEVAHKAFKVHGAYAYVKDFKIERLLRDANFGEIVEGANEMQRTIIASTILK
jgi:alkylation response protein AidB-like acyl-CoA dehydrogenase